jgi:hypothetical protein
MMVFDVKVKGSELESVKCEKEEIEYLWVVCSFFPPPLALFLCTRREKGPLLPVPWVHQLRLADLNAANFRKN